MWRTKSQSCGIKCVDNKGRIILTKKAEDEVKKLSFLLKKYSYLSGYEKCTYCRHNIEAMNDFCEIKNEHTICYEHCDQYEPKNMTEEFKKRRKLITQYKYAGRLGDVNVIWIDEN